MTTKIDKALAASNRNLHRRLDATQESLDRRRVALAKIKNEVLAWGPSLPADFLGRIHTILSEVAK